MLGKGSKVWRLALLRRDVAAGMFLPIMMADRQTEIKTRILENIEPSYEIYVQFIFQYLNICISTVTSAIYNLLLIPI